MAVLELTFRNVSESGKVVRKLILLPALEHTKEATTIRCTLEPQVGCHGRLFKLTLA